MEFKTNDKITHGSVRIGDWLVRMVIDENGRLRMRVENSKDDGVYVFESWTEGKAWAGEFSTDLIDNAMWSKLQASGKQYTQAN